MIPHLDLVPAAPVAAAAAAQPSTQQAIKSEKQIMAPPPDLDFVCIQEVIGRRATHWVVACSDFEIEVEVMVHSC